MKILVTGANGQLGKEIVRQANHNHELILTDYDTLDVTNGKNVISCLLELRPQAVIHCAAYTNVDKAEHDPNGAFRVNTVGTQNIAAGCLEVGARIVYVSTDYVFDGETKQPYREFDPVNPQNVYGLTKWQGEELVRQIIGRHYIIRTAWLFGDGSNFVRTMMNLADHHTSLRVVHDQKGTPTFAKDLTATILRLLNSEAYGTYHATCQGECSWYEFACEVFKQIGKPIELVPVTTAEFYRPAKRPANSVLDNYMLQMTVGDPMRSWQEALKEYLTRLREE